MYYHVSSYVKEGQTLKKETKNNQFFCEYISNCDISTCKKLIECYEYLCSIQSFKTTNRKEGKWCCESIFEYIRKTEYPDKPSRIWSIYLFAKLDDACFFLNEYRKPTIKENGEKVVAHIYQIEIPEEKVFVFDMNIYSEADNLLQDHLEKGSFDNLLYENICKKAREYWSGAMTNNPQCECLIDCDVIIGKKVI